MIRVLRAVLAAAALAAGAAAQAPNDSCATASPIVEGVPLVAASTGATTGPDPVACGAGNDVWFSFTPACAGQYTVSTCAAATIFDTVLAVWNGAAGCGALTLVGCNDNNCALTGHAFASRVNFTASAGGLYLISVGGKLGATGIFELQASLTTVMTLAFFDVGPATLGYHVTGPANGSFFTGMTLNAGPFPFGWFYGIDLPLFDIVSQFNFGPPFVGTFSPCGTATIGPVFGVPSGLTVYAVSLGFTAGAAFPTFASNPALGVAPSR